MNIYETGNTVRVKGTYKNNAGQPTDPSLPTVRIYDSNYDLITEVSLSDANKVGTGVYQYDYTIPAGKAHAIYYYEFYGEVTGVPALNRGQFVAKFFT